LFPHKENHLQRLQGRAQTKAFSQINYLTRAMRGKLFQILLRAWVELMHGAMQGKPLNILPCSFIINV
jgi:hypothetical protein